MTSAYSRLHSSTTAKDAYPEFIVCYEKKDITQDIAPYVLSLSYKDFLGKEADTIEIQLVDVNNTWWNIWHPNRGKCLELKIGYGKAYHLYCGYFEIDELIFSRAPSTLSIRAIAKGAKAVLNTHNTYAYEKTSLADIVNTVAQRYHFSVAGEILNIAIDLVVQYQESDYQFLTRLACEYGHIFKISGEKFIFSQIQSLCCASSVNKLSVTDIQHFHLYEGTRSAYKEASSVHSDSIIKQSVVTNTLTHKNNSTADARRDIFKLFMRPSALKIADAKAQAVLAWTQFHQAGGHFTVLGEPKFIAGNCFQLSDCDVFSGTYLVLSSHHYMNRSQGYLTDLEVRRV